MTNMPVAPTRTSQTVALITTLFTGICLTCSALALDAVPHGLQTLKSLDDRQIETRALQIQAWTTHEGAGVLFIETREIPVVDVSIRFAAGSSRDDDAPGLAAMTLKMLSQGAEGMEAQLIGETLDQLGAQLTSSLDKDEARLSLRTLSDNETRNAAVQLLTRLVSEPAFTPAAIDRAKASLLNELKITRHNRTALAQQDLHARLYAGHPYASAQQGNDQSLGLIDEGHVRAFHQKAYTAANALLVIVGDISLDDATTLSIALSQALPQGPALAPVAIPTAFAPPAGHTHLDSPASQTLILLAQPGVPAQHPDYVALQVANLIFGGASHNRLMNELRHKHGLTYGASSFMPAWHAGGPWTISLQTEPGLQDAAIERVKALFSQWLDEGPTEQELTAAKRQLAGNLPLTSASNAQMLQQLLIMGAHGLPRHFDALAMQAQSLTRQDIKEAINRQFKSDQWVITSHGPIAAQRPIPAVHP